MKEPPGRQWWFGFEANGPGVAGTTNRPLDKSQSPLGPYTANLADLLQCPDFPYYDSAFFPKFDQHAASYGYNIQFLGPAAGATASRRTFADRAAEVFVFADAVQFDFGTTFNEGHYIVHTAGAKSPSGYAHFRHANGGKFAAQVLFLGWAYGQCGGHGAEFSAGGGHADGEFVWGGGKGDLRVCGVVSRGEGVWAI